MLTCSHYRATHRTVLVTLAAWAFALMAGIANACVLHDRVTSNDGQVQAGDPDAPDAACDAAWKADALTTAKHEGRDSTPLEPAAVQTVGIGPNFVSVAVITQSIDEGVAARGPPGAIRFLRLRL